jgi:hypothetical protein
MAARRKWGLDAAEDLIRARAFADSRSAEDVAAEILGGRLSLD